MTAIDIIQELKKRNIRIALKDSQLTLSGDNNNLDVDLLALLKAHKADLISFFEQQNTRRACSVIPQAEIQPHYPLTNAQMQIWFLSQFEGANAAYKITANFTVHGALDIKTLKESLSHVVKRHETLRTVFREVNGQPRQFVREEANFDFQYRDLEQFPDPLLEVQRFIDESANYTFNLQDGPLFKAAILKIEANTHVMSVMVHHIISDGWSMGVLLKDLVVTYTALSSNAHALLPGLSRQYKDYVSWIAGVAGPSEENASRYWKKTFQTVPLLELPTARKRPPVRTFEGGILKFPLDATLTSAIDQFNRHHGATPFNFFRAVLAILLSKISGQDEIVIGTPVSNRTLIDHEKQIGLFVNTVPLKSVVAENSSFLDILSETVKSSNEAFEFRQFPFDQLPDVIGIKSDPSRNPLFDVMMVMQDTATTSMLSQIKSSSLSIDLLDFYRIRNQEFLSENRYCKFELIFNFCRYSAHSLWVEIEYASTLFDEAEARKLCHRLQHVIRQVLQSPSASISSTTITLPEESQHILTVFNGPVRKPQEPNVIELFERQVKISPAQTAIIFGEKRITYQELNEISNQVARYLSHRYGIGRKDLVAIRQERSEWLIISMVAVLKAGAAYVPIDPTYPPERIDYMTRDSGCRVVLDEEELLSFSKVQNEYSVEDIGKTFQNEDLIYCIYTSGSTGKPKGALVTHGSFSNLTRWYGHALNIDADDVLLLMAPISFDLAQKNVFTPLAFGAQIALPDSAHNDYVAIASTIFTNSVTVINAAPSAFYPLLDPEINRPFTQLASLKYVVLGGEPIRKNEFLPWVSSPSYHAKVMNSYGPTECTDVVSFHIVDNAKWHDDAPIPIGKPIDNTNLYVVDKNDQLRPVGLAGEICISGVCVGRGYHNYDALTSQKWAQDPYRQGAMMYRTGDLGKWLPDGSIEYLGRADSQMKIRGFRIEPAEIENGLVRFAGVSDAIVSSAIDRAGEIQIVAYYKAEKKIDTHALRTFLGTSIPAYMVPSTFVFLKEFPLTPSGKVDRKALPFPFTEDTQEAQMPVLPRNEMEQLLAGLWEDLLGRNKISIRENFFELGGNSISIVKMVSRANKMLKTNISPVTAFQYPNIEALADYLSTHGHVNNLDTDEYADEVRTTTLTLVNNDTNED